MTKGPLDGLKVLDLSRQLAGPFCTMTLGDLGAEIIKVEQPGRGDDSRHWGPFWNSESTYFVGMNRNKKSLELDLKSDEGKTIFLKLVKKSDVLIQNFRPGTIEKMGFGYEELKKINPKLVYCSISGYGDSGPLQDRGGLDVALQAFSGLMEMTGYPDNPPVRMGLSIADLATGQYALSGILAALNHRHVTGQGQKVDVSLMESLGSLINYFAVGYFASGELPEKGGSGLPNIVPYRAYKTKTEYLVIAIGNDENWVRFCKVLNDERLNKEEYRTNQGRMKHSNEVHEIIESHFILRAAEEWEEILLNDKITCSIVRKLDYFLTHPQMKARDMVVELPHPNIPDLKVMGIPMKFSETPGTIRTYPPLLGEHNEEILKNLVE